MADPREVLDLRPGAMVRVRAAREIFSTTGRMLRIQADCITLDSVTCEADCREV
jgi:hypothetical protein